MFCCLIRVVFFPLYVFVFCGWDGGDGKEGFTGHERPALCSTIIIRKNKCQIMIEF